MLGLSPTGHRHRKKFSKTLCHSFNSQKQFYIVASILAAASATSLSFSTVLPDTPMPPIMPSPVVRGRPPGKLMRPELECSMLYRLPPGWDKDPITSVFIWKKVAVLAFLIAMSTLPSQAPSILWTDIAWDNKYFRLRLVQRGDLSQKDEDFAFIDTSLLELQTEPKITRHNKVLLYNFSSENADENILCCQNMGSYYRCWSLLRMQVVVYSSVTIKQFI